MVRKTEHQLETMTTIESQSDSSVDARLYSLEERMKIVSHLSPKLDLRLDHIEKDLNALFKSSLKQLQAEME